MDQCGPFRLPNCLVYCLTGPAMTDINPLCLINEYITSGLKSGWQGETAGLQRVIPRLWRHHSHLFLELDAETWALPSLLGASGGEPRHVLFALRNGSGLFCGADSLSLCWRVRPPWERVGQSWWQWWTRWNNQPPPSLARFPHSFLPWQLAAAAHRRQENQHLFHKVGMELHLNI